MQKAFIDMGRRIGALVEMKNKAYGDSFSKADKILAVLYPDGVMPEQYRDMLAVVRLIDKLFRIANRKDAFGESPWKDIAGYGILGAVADELEEVKVGGQIAEEAKEFEKIGGTDD